MAKQIAGNAGMTDQGFSRDERIRLKRDFDCVFREGLAFRFDEILVRVRLNGLQNSRLGLSVSRRLGNAVRRNRMKRLLREAFRLNKGVLSRGCDIAVVPRSGWRDLSLNAIEPIFRKALLTIEKRVAPE